ncbi:MAG: hypothetical protein IIC73_02565 [Armatimonadetes bacterium]|nr:hypothetical protein [Armatimonadota bacterium]
MMRRSACALVCATLIIALVSCGKGVEEPDHRLAGTWVGSWSAGSYTGSATLEISSFSHLNGTLTGGNLPGSGGTMTGTITPEGEASGTMQIKLLNASSFTGTFSLSEGKLTGSIETNNEESLTFELEKQ